MVSPSATSAASIAARRKNVHEAVLDACDGLIVNVEIKNGPGEPGFDPGESIAQLVADTVADAGWTERVIVSSFRIETIRAVRDADPRLLVGWLVGLRDDVGASLAVAAEDLDRLARLVRHLQLPAADVGCHRGSACAHRSSHSPHPRSHIALARCDCGSAIFLQV